MRYMRSTRLVDTQQQAAGRQNGLHRVGEQRKADTPYAGATAEPELNLETSINPATRENSAPKSGDTPPIAIVGVS